MTLDDKLFLSEFDNIGRTLYFNKESVKRSRRYKRNGKPNDFILFLESPDRIAGNIENLYKNYRGTDLYRILPEFERRFL
jgi:hypothetical protein